MRNRNSKVAFIINGSALTGTRFGYQIYEFNKPNGINLIQPEIAITVCFDRDESNEIPLYGKDGLQFMRRMRDLLDKGAEEYEACLKAYEEAIAKQKSEPSKKKVRKAKPKKSV